MPKLALGTKRESHKKRRKGIVSKNKSSRHKGSKNYRKRYRGQGR